MVEESFDEAFGERTIDELEKFLGCCASNPGERFTPSDPVDKAWHALIVHTIAYREICHRLTGGEFIGHTPPRSPDEGHALMARFPGTVEKMSTQGVPIDRQLWTEASHSIWGCRD